jgi:hypothetical protein
MLWLVLFLTIAFAVCICLVVFGIAKNLDLSINDLFRAGADKAKHEMKADIAKMKTQLHDMKMDHTHHLVKRTASPAVPEAPPPEPVVPSTGV